MKVFDLLIYALMAVLLLFLFYQIISIYFPPESSIKKIQAGLEQAQSITMLGKTVQLGTLNYPKDFFVQKDDMAENEMILVIECNDASQCCIRKSDSNKQEKCTKAINWDYNFFEINETKKVNTTIRCIRQDNVPICKIYLGKIPAQAKVEKIELIKETAEGTEIKVTTTNTGTTQLAYGKNSLTLYKKSANEWQPTEYESGEKEVQYIMPGEENNFYWTISPQNTGKYKAEFIFTSINAGYDKKEIEFEKTLTSCETVEGTETTYDPAANKFWEIHYCKNCLSSQECVKTWNAKEQAQFYAMAKDKAYCLKATEDGTC